MILYGCLVGSLDFDMKNDCLKATLSVTLTKLVTALFIYANMYSAYGDDSIKVHEKLPSEIIDLTFWKITLPRAKKEGENAEEVKFPNMKKFSHKQYFYVDTSDKDPAVVFRAPCGGATTKNSKYPRCELREMTTRGKVRASWQTSGEELHVLIMRAAITHTPVVKKHVVCAQIHDSKNDLIMIRLEGKHLFIERNPYDDVSMDRDYKLGSPFDLKIQAGEGKIKVWYNGEQKMNWEKSANNCYFKAGCYTQSNPQRKDKPESYGEVKIYQLAVNHSKNHTKIDSK